MKSDAFACRRSWISLTAVALVAMLGFGDAASAEPSVPPVDTHATAASTTDGTDAFRGDGAIADDGAKIVRRTWIDNRTLDLVIASRAVGAPVPVRIILPRNWAAHTPRTWPVLYLLHGCCEPVDYRSWTHFTDVRKFMADKDVLTVMPSDGPSGFYTRWLNGPDWERFHLRELREIVEREFRAGQRRAVAGVSIGGYGAMAYAYRHPGMFRAAASYSGVLNTLQPGVPGVIEGIQVREQAGPLKMWGDPALQWPLWSERNPYDHVGQFSGTALYVSCGNGLPGPLDLPNRIPDPLEPSAWSTSKVFTDHVRAAGIPVTTHYYGDGSHDWRYWQRELHRSWPMVAHALGVDA